VARRTAGETIDFESLYRTSRDDLYAYVAGMVRDSAAAEEVTAAAFERALTRRSSYKPDRGSPRAWLFGIARNAAYDELRRRGRTEPAADPEGRHPPVGDATADVALRRAALSAALAVLSQEERDLLALKFEAGLPNGDIGTVLGISESNVGTRLSRVVAKLRAAME
jgi:RNA polymerase sigma-70 factor (ECF subfamily)